MLTTDLHGGTAYCDIQPTTSGQTHEVFKGNYFNHFEAGPGNPALGYRPAIKKQSQSTIIKIQFGIELQHTKFTENKIQSTLQYTRSHAI